MGFYRYFVWATCLIFPTIAGAQLNAPNRDWASTTQYVNSPQSQDSIFVFFAEKGVLSATHPSGTSASFRWFRYNPLIPDPNARFEEFFAESDKLQSQVQNLQEGGYRVVVTDNLTHTAETYTAWLFTDDVKIEGVSFYNDCDFMELTLRTVPNYFDIENDRFVYYDLSRATHLPNNYYGRRYFNNSTWEASDERIDIPAGATVKLTITEPAPLYNASYTFSCINPFGRSLQANTDEIEARATEAKLRIQVEQDGHWSDWSAGSNYEALLAIKLESESINADSLFWYVDNKSIQDYAFLYKTLWRDSARMADRIISEPDRSIMKPGFFRVRHYSYNVTSGCRDSVVVEVTVDSSQVKADAIPNVFSPNDDGVNDRFKFIDPERNITSVKTFSITIFSRSGKQVYEYSGDPRDWEGWNGRINGKGAKAAEGVYFFVIEATGWDGKRFRSGPYKGFLHLFRGER